MLSSSRFFDRVAALSLLATMGCSSYECESDVQVGSARGALVFTHSTTFAHAKAVWVARREEDYDPFGDDDASAPLHVTPDVACDANAAADCIEVWTGQNMNLTFRRPSQTGTSPLRDLHATVCERIPFPTYEGDPSSCADVDGSIVVTDVGSDHLEADVTISDAIGAAGPTVSGEVHLAAHAETISTPCGGGCGSMPPIGSLN